MDQHAEDVRSVTRPGVYSAARWHTCNIKAHTKRLSEGRRRDRRGSASIPADLQLPHGRDQARRAGARRACPIRDGAGEALRRQPHHVEAGLGGPPAGGRRRTDTRQGLLRSAGGSRPRPDHGRRLDAFPDPPARTLARCDRAGHPGSLRGVRTRALLRHRGAMRPARHQPRDPAYPRPPGHEEKAIQSLVASGLGQALVVFPVHGEYYNASLLRMILDGHALVLVDRYLSGIPGCAVTTDNVAAAKALTERVIDLGHRNITFVSPPPANTSSIEARLEGFRAAFADRGLAYAGQHLLHDRHSTLPGAFTPESVQADVQRVIAFLQAKPEVTAFVACEYNLARVLAMAMDTLDIRDTYLIACFDSQSDPVTGPAFLHVRQDQREMGRRAVELLLMQIRGEPVPKQSTVSFTIVDAAPSVRPGSADSGDVTEMHR